MTDTVAAHRAAWAEAWRPSPRRNLADWADAHFALPEGDANAGRWRTLGYQRGWLDAISDPTIERVTLMKSARVGYTKACLCVTVAYHIAEDPCAMLIVQPTVEDAEKHSKEDLMPMLRDLPCLRGKVADTQSRATGQTNTIRDKVFAGGSLSLVGANSPRGFRRTSRRIVIFDEVDGYPPSSGVEGDPIALGIRRTEFYWRRKILAGSTPTIAGASRIERLFLEGDQRRFYVPCVRCGTFQVLKFENLKWPVDAPELAHFICDAHGCVLEPRDKPAMLARGEWRAEAPEHFTDGNRHASFHIWAAYSASPHASWGQLAREYVAAAKDQIALRTYKNTVLGEPWREALVAINWDALYRRRESYRIGTVPPGAVFLTAGVDVQQDRLVYEIVGWGRGKTSWSIDAGVIVGETANLGAAGPWAACAALLDREYPAGRDAALRITRMAVDAGYATSVVSSWTRKYPVSRVIPIKGERRHGGGILLGAPQVTDVTRAGKMVRRGFRLWPVYTHSAKDELYGFLRLEPGIAGEPDPPGLCHFPEYGDDFFRQLTAEHLIATRDRRRYEYEIIPGRENHWLDARVYARAAAAAEGLDKFSETDWRRYELALGRDAAPVPSAPPMAPVVPATAPPMPPSAPPRRGGHWLQPPPSGWLRRPR